MKIEIKGLVSGNFGEKGYRTQVPCRVILDADFSSKVILKDIEEISPEEYNRIIPQDFPGRK